MSGGPFRQGGAPLRPGFFEEGSAADTAKMMPSKGSACLSHDNKLWNSERKPTQSEQKRMENAQMLINLVARDAVKKALQAESDLVCLIRDTQLAYEGLKKEGKTPNPRSALAWKSQNDIKELDPSAVEAFCLSRSKLLELFTLGCSMLMGAQLDGVAFRLLKALQEMSAVVVHTRALGDKWADVRRNIILGASSPFWPEYQLERVEPPAVLLDSALLLMLVDLGMGEKGVKEWGEQRKAPLVQNLDEVLKLAREKREQARARQEATEAKAAAKAAAAKAAAEKVKMVAQRRAWRDYLTGKMEKQQSEWAEPPTTAQMTELPRAALYELQEASETWRDWATACEWAEQLMRVHLMPPKGGALQRRWRIKARKYFAELRKEGSPTREESSAAEPCTAHHGV